MTDDPGLHGAETDRTYARAGFGAKVPRGDRPALVVVDLTRGFTEPDFPTGADLSAEVAAAGELVRAAHASGVPVIYTAIGYAPSEVDSIAWLRKAPGMRSLLDGSEEVALDPRLERRDSDQLIVKKGASAFHGTGLAALLSALHVDTVVVCGATTSGCVRATAVDSVQSGFDTLVVAEACGDRAQGPHDAALFDLQAKYADVVSLAEGRSVLAPERPARIAFAGNERLLTPSALADLEATSVWVRSGDLRLHLLDYGPDHATPLVILPGITSPAVTMDFVARELTDLVRPLVLDLRGRGLSDDGPPDGYDLASYAADVEAVLDELGLQRPILLGHSMGARIAAQVAVSGRPALGGLILVDPPMSGPDRPYPTTLATFLSQLEQARRGTDADEVATHWPTWPRREQELRARWLASCSPAAIAGTHAGFESEQFLPLWTKLTLPTTLLFGTQSPVVTETDVAELGRSNPRHRLIGVAGAGHMVFWDQPSAALRALRALLPAQ
ncbi:N-formylmaleamate deformylase [Amycolatopsis sulphurea]|uniref:N-formylmaleamate deformylase n=1 Tax=Amycolatopsis sulphurea TaxID=76022 RepID=A0A2A9FII5_9PSEU|nr:isochorismatase family protein [Amycolatopsis sulphurea]PFG50255.1 N-formylmaleamate deformylase [Amycolatopsis sulphurea]